VHIFSASADNLSGGASAFADVPTMNNTEDTIEQKRKTEYGRRMTSLRSVERQEASPIYALRANAKRQIAQSVEGEWIMCAKNDLVLNT